MHHTTQRLYTLITCPNFYVGIGTSTIHGAQRGLFTTKERNNQDYLCPYLGDLQKDAPNSSIGEYSFYSPGRNETVHGNPSTSYRQNIPDNKQKQDNDEDAFEPTYGQTRQHKTQPTYTITTTDTWLEEDSDND
jgi:hypothetical protein